jgi:hypothetical protein
MLAARWPGVNFARCGGYTNAILPSIVERGSDGELTTKNHSIDGYMADGELTTKKLTIATPKELTGIPTTAVVAGLGALHVCGSSYDSCLLGNTIRNLISGLYCIHSPTAARSFCSLSAPVLRTKLEKADVGSCSKARGESISAS